MLREKGLTANSGREWQKIAMDGNDLSRRWNKLSDEIPPYKEPKGKKKKNLSISFLIYYATSVVKNKYR